ncbi:hypothetical protein LY76DRAFT_319784 [Colletotrichum caudatum]|nr:hypothetical protein LY76DRAFT_319784 [Colletotrichum caudatum]
MGANMIHSCNLQEPPKQGPSGQRATDLTPVSQQTRSNERRRVVQVWWYLASFISPTLCIHGTYTPAVLTIHATGSTTVRTCASRHTGLGSRQETTTRGVNAGLRVRANPRSRTPNV